MRLALVCSITLACVAPVIAQSPQAGPIPMSRQEMRRKGIQALGKPVSPTLEVAPETPVVTLEGVCDRPQVAGAKGCKTVITRAQLDSMIELLAPETPQSARRQFAINYARLLAASEVAQRHHLEKEPAVIKELQAQLKLARMQVLASTLYRQIEEQAANVPASEIQKYYTDHQANFDEGEVLRLTIPKAAATESGQPLDASAVKATADALRARAAAEQIMPEPYERIHAQTMVPFAHLLWGSVWAGIAAAAVGKAQAFIRHVVRGSNGQMPPGAAHFTQAVSTLRTLRGVLAANLRTYEGSMADEKAISSLEFQAMITLTKVQASELAVTAVMSSLRACGLSGYRNDTEFTIGRLLRDVLSAPIMINNDRILTNLGASSLMTPLPTSISG